MDLRKKGESIFPTSDHETLVSSLLEGKNSVGFSEIHQQEILMTTRHYIVNKRTKRMC